MKRAGLLFLTVAPLATAAVFLFSSPPSDSQAQNGSPLNKSAAEKSADDKLIAELPPGLAAPKNKELAQRIVASLENSTLDWRSQYARIEDVGDGTGYTAGIVGFCTGTHDLLKLVEHYTKEHPGNGLAPFLPALKKVDGTDSHEGLDPGFTKAWKDEARKPAFRKAQNSERDRVYFDPAVRLAKLDGLGTLGQFIYFDAMVLHGPDNEADGFYGLRDAAMAEADTPAQGGKEKAFLDIFLDLRREQILEKDPEKDTSRIDTAQRQFLYDGNMDLKTPLTWKAYGETFRVP